MLAKFFIAAMAIFVAGPLEIEGGRESIQEVGLEQTVENAVKDAQPVDYSKMND